MREGRRVNDDENQSITRARFISVIGFLVAFVLISIAVFLSINQEKKDREAKLENSMGSNLTIQASSELGKSVNESKNSNIVKNELIIENSINSNNNTTNNDNLNNVLNNETNKKQEIETISSNVDEQKIGNEETIETNAKDISNQENENSSEESNNNSNENANNNSEEESKYIRPVDDGEEIKEFSMDSLIYSETLQEWVTHRGIDIKANKNAEVKSISDGTIKAIKNDPRYGISIIISHKGNITSVYSCLLEVASSLKEGDSVKKGQVIGKVGNSGVFESSEGMHLHFEMLKNDEYVNPDLYIK